MARWILKSAAQRCLSWLPCSYWWNDLLRKYVTKEWALTARYFEGKLKHCQNHLENYLGFSPQARKDFTVLELGTGWYPIMPVGLYLCGAAEIWSYDIVRLLHPETFRQMLQFFCEFGQRGTLLALLPQARPERLVQVGNALAKAGREPPAALLESLGIHALIGNAERTGLTSRSIDFVFSNTVLEMISRRGLANLFAEFKRVCSEDGVMSHHIGMIDMYSFLDRSISRLNFLKYPARVWRFLDSPLSPQNRLRVCDFRELFKETGFSIVKESNTSVSSEALRQIVLAPEFRNYPAEDLLVAYSWMVGRPTRAVETTVDRVGHVRGRDLRK